MWKTEKIKKFFNKKVLVGLFFVLILLVGGFFWWKEIANTREYNNPENFIIKETQNGKIVENKKAGLSISIDNNWTASIGDLAGEGIANFYSSDSEFYDNGGLKKGIRILMEILNCDSNEFECKKIERIISELKNSQFTEEETGSYEIINIGRFQAIKKIEIRNIDDNRTLEQVSINIPVASRLYTITGVLIPADEDRYSQLEDFIKGIDINK